MLISLHWKEDGKPSSPGEEKQPQLSSMRPSRGWRWKRGSPRQATEGWEALFEMEFNLGVFPPSACASRPYVFNHTTEEAFFLTSMLIPSVPPPQRELS